MAEAPSEDAGDNTKVMMAAMSRKEKRKALKKMRRKQFRREIALKEREEEEARLNDPEEQMRLLRLEEEEAERMERDRREFEERERRFLEELEVKKKRDEEEEEERRKRCEELQSKSGENQNANELDEDDGWEYVEEGPAEIIWKGNEIIVKKKKVRVPKKSLEPQIVKQESEIPISNPLAPQSEAFEDHKSAQEVLESVAQQVPNFGTEQDKAHCPFHLKTGVCRFGARCSRVHFYPDKSCTLLMKNMYNGPGLAWEQDEGLESMLPSYTDEEVERSFEDFYEDVHTEFLKCGEIVNFKVCKNSSSHLRGNVYVHYKSLDSAVLAYQSINGRYFAGKQTGCEFINITKWKVAICGEFMKSRLKACSRGSACNFIHCFRNPGGDYEWADWDKPAPRYWVKKMAALFGYASDRLANEISPSYSSRRSRSRGPDYGKSRFDEDDDRRHRRHSDDRREKEEMHEERYHHNKRRKRDIVDVSDISGDEDRSFAREKRSSGKSERDPELRREDSKSRKHEAYSDRYQSVKEEGRDRYAESSSRSSKRKSEKGDDFEPRDDSDPERRKTKRTPHRKGDTCSSDIDFHGDRHRHRSHSKRSSREVKYEADLSDSASDREIERDDVTKRQKNGRNSRSKNESDVMNIEDREKPSKDRRHHGHGRRRSSSFHSKDYCDVPSCEVEKEDKKYDADHDNEIYEGTVGSESECEQAYRLAALKKLEEMRKSKEHSERARTCSHNVGVKGEEVSKDGNELLVSSVVETRATSVKRKRI